jgi:hypothetical protein
MKQGFPLILAHQTQLKWDSTVPVQTPTLQIKQGRNSTVKGLDSTSPNPIKQLLSTKAKV